MSPRSQRPDSRPQGPRAGGRPKLTDVARAAQVSPAIVSRLLRQDASLRVRDETRRRVLAAAESLGYTPDETARALRSSAVGVIGVVVREVSNPVYSEILAGAQEEAGKAGIALLLADAAELSRNEKAFERVVRGNRVDGLLLQRGGGTPDELVGRIRSSGTPLLLVNDRSRGSVGSVALDDEGATRVATSHLVGLGHSKIGHLSLGGPQGRSAARSRGWAEVLRESGIPAPPQVVGGHTIESGLRAFRRLPQGITALVASNVMAAVGLMSAARTAGMDVPGDLAIVAVHDVSFAAHLTPALTVVRMPLHELGRRSVRGMLGQLSGDSARHDVVVRPAPELVVRESCGSKNATVR
ncbi:LacI family DNA-binding transcriptional regulator [Streptomyces sp. NPDC056405]|uniref:LacI family DNA-binding transcriptional regulator n=1 Tax=Streptomyces sp. NPDC056405 TaxID=3345811 RepID=UPI0035D7DCAC